MKTHTLGFITVLFLAVTVLLFAGCLGDPKPTPLPKWDNLEPINVENLSRTNISGILNSPVQQGTNQVFCATYCILAQELIKAFPSIQIVQGADQIETLVDTEIAYKEVLADRSVFRRAGWVNETELRQLDKDLLSRFPEAEPFSSVLRGSVLYSVVYIDKKMPWKVVFHGDLTISFGAKHTPVHAFGFSTFLPASDVNQEMAKQVTIHYMDQEWDANEIVLSLHPESETDEVIIGMVKPYPTLQETYEYVLRRIDDSESEYKFDYNSTFKVPKINFNVRDKIPRSGQIIAQEIELGISGELIGEMRVAMSLDERGASAFSRGFALEESAGISVIIDKPFIVAFREHGSDLPYIAAWIENIELLVPKNFD